MNCENCTRRPDPVPYTVHESAMARAERSARRLWIVILVLIVMLAGSNAAWIWYESQYIDEYTSVDQEIDTGEGSAFVAGIGDVNYGTNPAESNEKDANP